MCISERFRKINWRRVGKIILYLSVIAVLAFVITIVAQLLSSNTITWDWKLIIIPMISIAVIGPLSGFLYTLWGKIWKEMREKEYDAERKIYSAIWKKSSELSPIEILGAERGSTWGGFKGYYLEREEDKHFREKLKTVFSVEGASTTKRHVLVLARPLAGKTRMVYEWLIKEKAVDVLIPHYQDIEIEPFFIPKNRKKQSRKVLLLDDLQRYIEFRNFIYFLNQFLTRADITIVATCRSEIEYDKVRHKLLEEGNIDIENSFTKIEIEPIDETIAKTIAEKIEKPWKEVEFDGTIGSILLPIAEMARRFKEKCTAKQKTVLRAVKVAYLAGLIKGKQSFLTTWIKTICRLERFELEMSGFEWQELIEGLESLEFLKKDKDKNLLIEEIYLERIIDPKAKYSLADFEELKLIFASDPEALLLLSNRLFEIGEVVLEKATYMKTAIETYQLARKSFMKGSPEYAKIQNDLGLAFCRLVEVEDKAKNSKQAIRALEEALYVYTLEQFPMDYAMTQNNLGTAYSILAEVEDTKENCQEAIAAYHKALRVYTLKQFPMDHAMIQNNLGAASRTLAEVENKKENCRKAITAYHEALRAYTLEQFPMQYAMIQNNLGIAYRTLAEVEEKKENCQKAITAYHEALKVRTLDQFPMDYAMTQNNLGAAYGTLADVEEKAGNCKKAIKAYQEALKVRTLAKLPFNYADTQINLGTDYLKLAQVENKAENCQKALAAFQEALKVFTIEHYPLQHFWVQQKLKEAKAFCSEGSATE